MINVELKIIINLFAYSILFFSFWDLYVNIKDVYFKNKILKFLLDILFIILITVYTFKYTYLLHEGYIPGLFFVFILLGYLIYYNFLKSSFNKITLRILISIKIFISKICIIIKPFIYSNSIFTYLIKTFNKIFKIKKIK